MLALRIQLSRDGQHVIGEIDECHFEVPLEMEGIVATSTPKLENRTSRGVRRAQQRSGECCFLGVLLWPGEQRPPRRKITVQMVPRWQVPIMVLGSWLGHLLETSAGLSTVCLPARAYAP
jgi:hypothetical protein